METTDNGPRLALMLEKYEVRQHHEHHRDASPAVEGGDPVVMADIHGWRSASALQAVSGHHCRRVPVRVRPMEHRTAAVRSVHGG